MYSGYPINSSLTSVYFEGNAPTSDDDLSVFSGNGNVTVYYLPRTTGWDYILFESTFTALWLPPAQTTDSNFGVKTN
jgi:hypothetical protein